MRPQNQLSFRPANPDVPGALLCRSGDIFAVWSFDIPGALWQLNEQFSDITCAEWSPDGSWLALGSGAKVLLVDPDFRSIQQEIELDHEVTHFAFSPNNSLLALSFGNKIRFWDTDRQDFLPADPIDHPKEVVRLIFDNSGTRLASVTDQKHGATVRVSQIDDAIIEELFEIRCQYIDNYDHWRPFWPVFTMDDEGLLVRGRGRRLTLVDSTTGEKVSDYVYSHPIYSTALPPDGNMAIVGIDGSVPIYQFRQFNSVVSTKPGITRVGRLKHPHQVYSTAIGPSGMAATAGSDKTVRLWNLNADDQSDIERIIPEKTFDYSLSPGSREHDIIFFGRNVAGDGTD